MSNQQDSNVIHIDFQDRKALKKSDGTKTFSQLIGHVIAPVEEGPEEWPEDLTPKERREQLKRDLDFLRQMNDIPPAKKY
ncbi:MAG: hypothetical protein KBT75_14350 [Oleispira antarctica]|uniref:Uncharacterized protein n=1 Tax=Oleispira antarctica RB-8 TaxID=698738 RepID=R4YSM3_OLEAN|nr:hypothetical protein [Oleispira antarctica]MBQ0793820.1 hypothetical protein [Oleispira antarctica]CCK76308.1 hypothetical protein OLEAN_C21320 [Oleispira antarctica RB-8]